MPRFFTDNNDIRFLFDHLNLAEVARLPERGLPDAPAGATSARCGRSGLATCFEQDTTKWS